MKLTLSALTLAATCAVYTLPVSAADEHKIITPQDVKWSPAPPTIPKGAEAALLFGDPSKEGPFAMRLKFPKGYQIAPHTHPKLEVVTVLSGTLRLGMGETADLSKAQALPTGAFFAFPPGMAHYVSADEDTVISIERHRAVGVSYVNPKDDPRKSQ